MFGSVRKLCCLKLRSVQQLLISASGCSLSAGWAVSLPGQHTCGVSIVPLLMQESRTLRSNQLLSLVENNNFLEKSLMFLGITHLVYTSFYYIVNLFRRATALCSLEKKLFFLLCSRYETRLPILFRIEKKGNTRKKTPLSWGFQARCTCISASTRCLCHECKKMALQK